MLDAKNVAMKQHSVSGTSLKVTVVETWPELLSCAVRIRGLNDNVSEDILKLLFENEKRSGGGAIEEVFIEKHSGTATITFESREGWKLSLKILSVIFSQSMVELPNSVWRKVISFITDYNAVTVPFSLRVVECMQSK